MNKKYIQETLKNYIDTLINNQANTPTNELQHIFSRQDYYLLLKQVLEIIKENKFASNTTIRLKLLEKSGLKEMIKSFVYGTQITPGIVMEYGTRLSKDIIICGDSQEYKYDKGFIVPDPREMEYDTIFDLASTSKLFTSLAIYKCVDDNLLDLHRPVTEYIPELTNLNDVTVYELLTFSKKICTRLRIDSTNNPQEAKKILMSAYVDPVQNLSNAYTDIGAMILRIVVERVTKMPFNEFLKIAIFEPAHMEDTHLNVPQEKIERCANENFSIIIRNSDRASIRMNNHPGTPHDPKANSIGHSFHIAPGHAGYFSTTPDMIKLGDALLDGKIITKDSLHQISNNVVGKVTEKDGIKKYNRYYGSLVYLKQPDPANLSVYPPLSGKSFMSPGFAGTTFCCDPLNEITLFIGSNRLHNRIYQIPPSLQTRIKTNASGAKTYKLPNGQERLVSMTFTKDKEKLVKLALDLSIQYQFLEILTKQEKELHLIREI